MSPPFPEVASPVVIMKLPEVPADALPVCIWTVPLTPEAPALGVEINKFPLDDLVL